MGPGCLEKEMCTSRQREGQKNRSTEGPTTEGRQMIRKAHFRFHSGKLKTLRLTQGYCETILLITDLCFYWRPYIASTCRVTILGKMKSFGSISVFTLTITIVSINRRGLGFVRLYSPKGRKVSEIIIVTFDEEFDGFWYTVRDVEAIFGEMNRRSDQVPPR